MKWVVGMGLVLIAVVAVVVGIGLLLPMKHRASESARLLISAEDLWDAITNFAAYPGWRSGVVAVERLPDLDGRPVWKEVDSHDEGIAYETAESTMGQRLVRRIADTDLPFGGTWTFVVETTPEGSMLTIAEDGEVYNPVFRFVSRFIIGHTSNIHGYLRDLEGKTAGKTQ